MDSDVEVSGAIVDSWVEPPRSPRDALRVVLQVAPLGKPEDLITIEADPSLLPDRGWLEDLGANLCHGSPVAAVGKHNLGGLFSARQLRIAR